MVITRETDYAIRTIRALSGNLLLTVKQICEQEAIPTQFAYKILKKLSRAGYIHIIRGAAGGYELTADLDKLTLLDLMEAMEEDTRLNACMRPGYVCACNDGNRRICLVHAELARIQTVLNMELKRTPLQQILFPAT